jgi:hypothetical protein
MAYTEHDRIYDQARALLNKACVASHGVVVLGAAAT